MSGKKSPADSNNEAGGSRTPTPPPSEHISVNSFDLQDHETHTSNLRHGAIGGPAAPLNTQLGTHIRPNHFHGRTSLAALSLQAAGNQKQLVSTQPARSWVTNLSTWRHATENTAAPSALGEQARSRGRPGASQEQPAREDEGREARAIEEQEKALQKYQDQGGAKKSNEGQMARHGGLREFRPMNIKLNPGEATRALTEEEKAARLRKGISVNYLGDVNNPANESANIPEWQNCSVWITNLPPDCSYRDLLGAMAAHHPGKVWASYISKPQGKQDEGPSSLPSRRHCAAKVVFYYAFSAQTLIRAGARNTFWVGGYLARVVPNRIRSAPQALQNPTTRVLEFEGPASIVNESSFRSLWKNQFDFDTEEVRLVGQWFNPQAREVVNRIVWFFGSHRSQAIMAINFIVRHEVLRNMVRVQYAQDPCDLESP